MGVRSSHMTPFYLNHLCKGLSSNSHILRYYGLGIQSMNSERTQFSLLHPLASILKRWHIHSSPGVQPGSTAQLAAHCSHTIFHRPVSCLHLQRQNTMASRNVPNISMSSILITHNQPLLKAQRTASLMLEKSMADILSFFLLFNETESQKKKKFPLKGKSVSFGKSWNRPPSELIFSFASSASCQLWTLQSCIWYSNDFATSLLQLPFPLSTLCHV